VTLEQRIRRIEDRFEISDLLVKYAVYLDDCRWDDLADLFAEDGVFASPNSSTTGRAAVIENFKAKHAPFPMTLHDPHGSTVEFLDDDHARGVVIGYGELANPQDTVVTYIRYCDDYVRGTDGKWRFASRHVLSHYGMTVADHVAGLAGTPMRKAWPGRPAAAAELPDVEHRFGGYV